MWVINSFRHFLLEGPEWRPDGEGLFELPRIEKARYGETQPTGAGLGVFVDGDNRFRWLIPRRIYFPLFLYPAPPFWAKYQGEISLDIQEFLISELIKLKHG